MTQFIALFVALLNFGASFTIVFEETYPDQIIPCETVEYLQTVVCNNGYCSELTYSIQSYNEQGDFDLEIYAKDIPQKDVVSLIELYWIEFDQAPYFGSVIDLPQ